MRSVENAECGKCRVWKMRSVENEEYSPKIMYYLGSQFFSSIKRSPLKCHYDEIFDIRFFTFSNTIGLS